MKMVLHHKNSCKNSGRIQVQKLTVALFMGFCVVLITYLVSTQPPGNQQKIIVPYNAKIGKEGESVEKRNSGSELQDSPKNSQPKPNTENPSPANLSNKKQETIESQKPDEQMKSIKPICDTSNPRSDICDMKGDVRVHGPSNSVILVENRHTANSHPNEWSIRPYARKNMEKVPRVTVKVLTDALQPPPDCTVNHTEPALVFANGGFTGNYFHDFTDILVPLFATSRRFHGDVHFVVTNIQRWWLHKYGPIISGLSRHEIIDFNGDDRVHCFPRAVVGMYFHDEMNIDPRTSPDGVSMPDFTSFMRLTYSLPREFAVNLKQSPDRKPRLLVISRRGTRKLTNVKDVAETASDMGFEVVVDDAGFGANVSSVASSVNSFDAMMGVHGAGLTNFVFLPTNGVVIQIVPWGGLERMCEKDFGFPSVESRLFYLQYSICEEESSLIDEFPRDHAVFVNPRSIHDLGWEEMGRIYLVKQNVKIDIDRFRPVLQKALEHLSQ